MEPTGRTYLAVDVETTGLDPEKDKMIELGWALFDVDRNRLILSGGTYLNRDSGDLADKRVMFSDEILKLTRIERDWVNEYGEAECSAVPDLEFWTRGASAVAAHNAAFDRAFLEKAGFSAANGIPWIDTQRDLPDGAGDKHLQYAALDRGVLSFFPHRAQFDAVMCGALLGTFPFDEVLERAMSPNIILMAEVSFADKDLAKNAGYRWEKPIRHNDKVVFKKLWVKSVKEMDVAAERRIAGEAGFVARVVQGGPQ